MGGVTISNGPCWSPDGGTFYFTDSAAKIVSAFDYDLETGTLSNRRVFADTSTYPGVPDGATVDAEGFYWMAICGAGMILRLGPDGAVVREIPIPTALTVSSVMFGGADLDRLFVTSIGESSLGLDTGSEGGGLFVIDGLGVRGLPEPRFAG
jgi:sugar lactone lactonase YvrE